MGKRSRVKPGMAMVGCCNQLHLRGAIGCWLGVATSCTYEVRLGVARGRDDSGGGLRL